MRLFHFIAAALLLGATTFSASAKIETLSATPYRGAITLNAANGATLFEDNADAIGYPASSLKLMTLLIIVEKVESGAIRLGDRVIVTAEAAKMGGSQVYLKEKETFAVDELLDALMIQSANDAAVALAIHVAGSRDAFVRLMNEKAKALGMKNTHFVSPHGLPPSSDQAPDTTTARDLGLLGLELAKHPLIFRYTSTKVRGFRNNTFEMRNHNKLLGTVDGVDGFKTGYFNAAGYTIVATAQREGGRIIAVVLGSENRNVRDQKATELLAAGFLAVPRPAVVETSVESPATNAPSTKTEMLNTLALSEEDTPELPEQGNGGWWKIAAGVIAGAILALVIVRFLKKPTDLKKDLIRR